MLAWLTGRTTSPAECALAFALPRYRKQFAADLRAGPRKDLAATLVERPPNRTDRSQSLRLACLYRPADLVISDTLRSVKRAGVTVVTEATPAALAELFPKFGVVTLVSHWKPDDVYPDDVIDWPGLARKLIGATNGFLGWLTCQLERSVLKEFATVAVGGPPPNDRQELLADALIAALRSGRFVGDRFVPRGHPLVNGYRNRPHLDAALATELRPGNRIEFFDGLHAPDVLTDCVPAEYAGILDLTVCNSVFMAEAVKSDPAKRSVRMLSNTGVTKLNQRLLIYKQVIELVARHHYYYRDAVFKFRSRLLF